MTIKELEQVTILSIKQGSLDAFNLCYDLYYSALCSYANLFVKQPAVTEEIIQNIFLELWMNHERLPDHTTAKAYLMTAVKHDCLDFLKHKKIEQKYANHYLQSMHDSYDDIFNDLVSKDLQRSLDIAISKLPPHCREIFLMSRFNYFPYKEIALNLNISVKTVENQIGKALKIVRKELDPYL